MKRSLWLAVGAAVCGLAVGALSTLLLSDDDPANGGLRPQTAHVDRTPVRLPERLGSFRDVVQVTASKTTASRTIELNRERQARTEKLTRAAYSKAFGGAGAGYRAFSDESLEHNVSVIAVRAPAPGPTFGPVTDAHDLLVAKPQNEVIAVGDVQCVAWWDTVPEGVTVKDSAMHVNYCQRSEADMAVFAYGGGFEGQAGLRMLASITADAWASMR